ncbi:hypothetical protein EVAR_36067_1 [Eumeta japonica]|uniref:Uncharacterized protein n=1 Tax=Eumeta variegata TaxID=151549 RepID=A0A4C1ZG48_EUMVA|nr:hypothetical protein EVAR_36067_1 [Eumeta japonica]
MSSISFLTFASIGLASRLLRILFRGDETALRAGGERGRRRTCDARAHAGPAGYKLAAVNLRAALQINISDSDPCQRGPDLYWGAGGACA